MALYPPEEPAIRTQEDVNKAYKNGYKVGFKDGKQRSSSATLRTWVGLTDEDCFEALKAVDPQAVRLPLGFSMFAANIQAKLKEKNS